MIAAIVVTLLLSAVEYRCVRWSWSGDVFNRRVNCLEWRKVDRK